MDALRRRWSGALSAYALAFMLVHAAGCERPPVEPEPRDPVATLDLVPFRDTLEAGSERTSVRLTPVLKDAAGNILTGRRVEWRSTRPQAVVDSTGFVVLVADSVESATNVTIVAISEGVTGTADLTVYPRIARVSVRDAYPVLAVGARQRLRAVTLSEGGRPLLTGPPIWSSSDAGVVEVGSDGTVTARGIGAADVTATTVLGHRGTFTFRVVPAAFDRYRLTWLGTLGGDSGVALDVNDLGQVVGRAKTADGEWHAFLWSGGVMRDLGTLRDWSAAHAINNRGEIVGATRVDHPFYTHAVRWRAGQLERLGFGDIGADINDDGQIAVLCHAACSLDERGGARWKDGSLARAPGPITWDSIGGINRRGDVVGGTEGRPFGRAYLWAGDTVRTVDERHRAISTATAINDLGWITGYGGRVGSIGWLKMDTLYLQIGTVGELPGTRPVDLNEENTVVGYVGNGDTRGFVARNGLVRDLSGLLTDPRWVVLGAFGINEAGQIVGYARDSATATVGAVLLTPER